MNGLAELALTPLLAKFQSPGPDLFSLGPITVRWYGLLIAIAVLIGVTISQQLAQKRGVDPEKIGDLLLWVIPCGIVCARIYYVLFEWSSYASRPLEAFAIWQGGIAIHGAVIGGTLATWFFAKANRLSFWQLCDFVAPSLILGQALGRWGNFFNSEAFGGPTDLPWKLFIPLNNRPAGYQDVEYFHPTFLYESLWNLGVFALLIGLFFWGLTRPRFRAGTVFLVYMIAYGAGRIWIEGLRTDSLMLGPIRVAQLISLATIALGWIGLIWTYGMGKRLPDNSYALPNGSVGSAGSPSNAPTPGNMASDRLSKTRRPDNRPGKDTPQ